jgi:hypothetical protein
MWLAGKRRGRGKTSFYWPDNQRVRNAEWLSGEPNNRMGRE